MRGGKVGKVGMCVIEKVSFGRGFEGLWGTAPRRWGSGVKLEGIETGECGIFLSVRPPICCDSL